MAIAHLPFSARKTSPRPIVSPIGGNTAGSRRSPASRTALDRDLTRAGSSHLLAGLLLARAGALDDAEQAFAALAAENHDSGPGRTPAQTGARAPRAGRQPIGRLPAARGGTAMRPRHWFANSPRWRKAPFDLTALLRAWGSPSRSNLHRNEVDWGVKAAGNAARAQPPLACR
jgi:hypothetical protein